MHRFKPLPPVLAVASLFSYLAETYADNTAQALPFAQKWSDISLIYAPGEGASDYGSVTYTLVPVPEPETYAAA